MTKKALSSMTRHLGRLAQTSVGLLVWTALRCVRVIYPLYVQQLRAERIGHLAIEAEIFRTAVPSDVVNRTIFVMDGLAANEFLELAWRRVLPVLPRWIGTPYLSAVKTFPSLELNPPGWDASHFDLRSLDNSPVPNFFTAEEEEKGRKLLRELGVGVGRPYICLSVRDSAYLSRHFPERNWAYHNYRDSRVETYLNMAKALTDAGFAVIRMGSQVLEPLNSDDAYVIDYANSEVRSPFGDVFLYANCHGAISTSTGVDSLAMLFRKPLGLVNLASLYGLQLGSHLKLVMFKEVVSEDGGNRIPVDDARFKNCLSLTSGETIVAAGFALLDNSSQELEAFGRDFVDLLRHPDAGCRQRKPAQMQAVVGLLGEVGRAASFEFPDWWLAKRMKDTATDPQAPGLQNS